MTVRGTFERWIAIGALGAAALAGCGDPGGAADGGEARADASTPEDARIGTDSALPDGAPDRDADAPRDDGGGGACGDSARDGDELCDGDERECATLARSYSGGTATCRSDCRGYDVSACTRDAMGLEYVKPALRDARWADAMCSESGEFFFTVLLTGASTWHISLEGGGYCSPGDINPCHARPDTLTQDAEERGGDIVHVTDGERVDARRSIAHPARFAGANVVRLQYCSNDLWSGTRTTPLEIPAGATGTATMPYVFSGRINVAATIEALQQRFGLDDSDPDTAVFFMGSSAGGHGVLNNADQLARLLPSTTARGRLHGLAVAGHLPSSWGAASAAVPGDWSLVAGRAHSGLFVEDVAGDLIAAWQSRFSPTCEAAHPTEIWRCGFAATQHPFLTDAAPAGLGLAIAMAQNLTDPFYQGMHGLIRPSPRSFFPGGAEASAAWASAMAAELAPLRWIYAPRHELDHHGIPLDAQPVDRAIPTLGALMDAFVETARPDDFRYVDFGRLE
ncbi:MAG: pectinacetylesterase family protein [Myxococcota bacterium]|nr:pectinacetylesterase family protein [Myxococcota bacterium]